MKPVVSFTRDNGGIIVLLATCLGVVVGYLEWRIGEQVDVAVSQLNYATPEQVQQVATRQERMQADIRELKSDLSDDINDLRTTIDNLIQVLLEDNGRRGGRDN